MKREGFDQLTPQDREDWAQSLGVKLEELESTIRDELKRFRSNIDFFHQQRQRLLTEFPRHWVAVTDGQKISTGKDLEGLLSLLDQEKLPRRTAFIEYLDPNPRPRILKSQAKIAA